MRSDISDAPSPDLPSAASNSSTVSSSGRRDRVSSSPAAHHLHFASDVHPSPSSSSRLLQPSGPHSTGRRTPQPHLPSQRRTSRPISADPLSSPHDRRASLAASAYTTAPSSVTARRTSMARLRNARPVKKEDAEVWEFGENSLNPGLTASASSRKGPGGTENEQLQQRLARIDMDLVMQALQEQSPPPRQDFGISTSTAPLNPPPPPAVGTRRSSSFATSSSPLRVEDLRLHSGSPDSSRAESGKERGRIMRILSGTKKGREKMTPEEEEVRIRAEEMQRIERIRHIHSTLTHSTQSRAESAKMQFEARYSYLLSAPPHHGGRPPTFLDVVKWKRSVRDIGRLKRRHESRVALSRGQSLSRVNTTDSAGELGVKSITSSPSNIDSRRGSFNMSSQSAIPQSVSSEMASHWAEQLIMAKHRRKRSVLSGSSTALAWDSAGMIGKSSDWDFTAQDIMEFLACSGTVEPFVPPVGHERDVRSSEERESMELEKILRRTVGVPGQDKSAPPSVISITSADDSAAENHIGPMGRGRPVHLNVVPPTHGKRQLSLVTEDEPESPTDATFRAEKRRDLLLSAPESPVSGREDQSPSRSPRFHRSHSIAMGRGGSISQAFGNFLNLSGSVAGSQEAFGAAPSGVASSKQSITGKRWAPVRLRLSLEETRDKSPDGSASEHLLSAVNSDNDVGSGTDLPWRRGRGTKTKRKLPSLKFNRRALAAGAENSPLDSALSLATPGPIQESAKIVLPNVPGFEKEEEEEPEESVDSEEEAAEYERKSRILNNVQLQVSRMDNVLASARIKHLAQELLDMRAQTLTMHTGAPVALPPLPDNLPSAPMPSPRPRPQDLSVVRNLSEAAGGPHVLTSPRTGLPRTISEPLPTSDAEESSSIPRVRPIPPSRSASLPQSDEPNVDPLPHIQSTLEHLTHQWQEIDTRLDALFSLQQSAFQTHARMQTAVEASQAQYFSELQVMNRLDDRIHALKTRHVGNSWFFTILAALAEVLLFVVWFVAKIIQLVFFRIPKWAYKAVVKLFVFLWWLIRWVLFLDYLWP
ncbi:hypothetical protein DACRYDRAFT_117607 [Dacryopinax primogenitus]|uniref:Uncharacterized protein n=1 Tax=Dacryopinax primogenitus (strain DJM 731) TaxID=1858805 RepID=M5FUR6_DACPD|nr:uncharacterized protein DACRYDRAFT_117607 [Dacryopinax primogenitus]EJT99998.1 hypothetical protein DACRYDRAFT_117607 [Dacryopinax primogenitus]